MSILSFAVGMLTGILSGFGIGGGSLLILYLTNVAGMNQRSAGGINLLYFLCCAPAALIAHIKHHRIDKRAVLLCTLAGVPAAVAAALLATGLDTDLLRRGFGVLLLYIGVKELTNKPKK